MSSRVYGWFLRISLVVPRGMVIPEASLTGPIVEFCVNVIDDTGLWGIFLLMGAASACIPIPSEAVMLFAGFTVSEGHHTLLQIMLAGFIGNMAGSWLTYAIGYYGRVDFMERNKLIHLHPAENGRGGRPGRNPPPHARALCRPR